MKPRTRAVYLSTMWTPLGQGGEGAPNEDNIKQFHQIMHKILAAENIGQTTNPT